MDDVRWELEDKLFGEAWELVMEKTEEQQSQLWADMRGRLDGGDAAGGQGGTDSRTETRVGSRGQDGAVQGHGAGVTRTYATLSNEHMPHC